MKVEPIFPAKTFNERLAQQLKSDVAAEQALADIIASITVLNPEMIRRFAANIAGAINYRCKIYLTAVGKPRYIAMKNVDTMKSIEIDAEYLDANAAGHGDLGSMPANAYVIAFSKSGKSTELHKLFEQLNNCRPNVNIVLLTQATTDVEQVAAIYSDIKNFEFFSTTVDVKEFDGQGLIPSTSNIVFEAVMSASLAFAMKVLGEDIDLYKRLQRSHPSGTLQTKVSNLIKQIEA